MSTRSPLTDGDRRFILGMRVLLADEPSEGQTVGTWRANARGMLDLIDRLTASEERGSGMEWRMLGHGVLQLISDGDEVARIRPYMTNETPVAGWVVTGEGEWHGPKDEADSLTEALRYARTFAAQHGEQVPPLPPEAEAVDRVFRLGGG